MPRFDSAADEFGSVDLAGFEAGEFSGFALIVEAQKFGEVAIFTGVCFEGHDFDAVDRFGRSVGLGRNFCLDPGIEVTDRQIFCHRLIVGESAPLCQKGTVYDILGVVLGTK